MLSRRRRTRLQTRLAKPGISFARYRTFCARGTRGCDRQLHDSIPHPTATTSTCLINNVGILAISSRRGYANDRSFSYLSGLKRDRLSYLKQCLMD
jgi:hypothetical protein